MTPQELSRAETAIARAKDETAKAEGAIEQIDKDLLDRFGLKSVEEAEAEVTKLDTQIAALDRNIQEDEQKLRDEFKAAGILL